MPPDLLEATSPLWPAVCGFLVLACLRTDASGFVILTSMSAAGFLLCSCLSSPPDGGGRRGEEEGVVVSARVSGASVENPRRKRAMEERVEKDEERDEREEREERKPTGRSPLPHSRGHAASLPPRQTRDSQRRLREALMDDLFGEGR